MKYTENLKLPIFDNPSEDLFKVSDWNEANENIEATLTEIKDWKDNAVSTNPIAEIIDARCGEKILGDKIRKIDNEINLSSENITNINSQLDDIVQDNKETKVPLQYNGAIFTVIDDDCKNEVLTRLKQSIDKLGIKISFGAVTNNIGTIGNLTKEQLLALQNDGHDILSHSASHSSDIYKSSVATASDDVIYNDMKTSYEYLKNNGFNGYKHLVYPWGEFGDKVLKYKNIARQIYETGINANGTYNTMPIDNMYIGRKQINCNENFDTVLKPIIDNCIAQNGFMVLLTHSGDYTNFTSEFFETVINYIKNKGAKIMPYTQALKYKGNVLSVGEYTDKNSFYLGKNGINNLKSNMIYFDGIDNQMDRPISFYTDDTINIIPIRNTLDTLNGNGGVMTVYKSKSTDFCYATFAPANVTSFYIRRWNNSTQSWTEWTNVSGTKSFKTRLSADLISNYPIGSEIVEVGNSQASGFPENSAGILKTYRGEYDVFSFQEYHIRQSNKVYKRYADANNSNAWTSWTKISVV